MFLFKSSCRQDINECQNGGTAIWDPVKSFSCLCKEGYMGELCEKGSFRFNPEGNLFNINYVG
jgi:hypothetical protein